MDRIEKLVDAIRQSQKNVKFSVLEKVCNHYFGEPRQRGTSHIVDCKQSVFRTDHCLESRRVIKEIRKSNGFGYTYPDVAGESRVNIQKGKSGKAKVYQVKQVLAAIDKIESLAHQWVFFCLLQSTTNLASK